MFKNAKIVKSESKVKKVQKCVNEFKECPLRLGFAIDNWQFRLRKKNDQVFVASTIFSNPLCNDKAFNSCTGHLGYLAKFV